MDVNVDLVAVMADGVRYIKSTLYYAGKIPVQGDKIAVQHEMAAMLCTVSVRRWHNRHVSLYLKPTLHSYFTEADATALGFERQT